MRRAALVLALVATACASPRDPSAPRRLPCDVDAALDAACRRCHGAPPAEGAGMSLVTYDDTQAPYSDDTGYHEVPTWQVMGDVLRAGAMPEPPVEIDAADRATLLDWIGRAAPPAAEDARCE